MCGIVGFASSSDHDNSLWLKEAVKLLIHRGPDNQAVYLASSPNVGLGHTRLAIIDLTSNSNQPMHSNDKRFILTFNGEIYNHLELRNELIRLGYSFQTKSDTEVLLTCFQHWGRTCVNRLKGMFAFAILDSVDRKLYLARDIAGEKPLYYYFDRHTKTLIFASELKALLHNQLLPKKLCSEQLINYLAYGYTSSSSSILDGYNKLPPGNILEFSLDDSKFRYEPYWVPPFNHAELITDTDLLERQFELLLSNAVEAQLSADVPAAILLSGGLDSSIITALATQLSSNKPSTFNVSFGSTFAYDESAFATQVSEYFGTDHRTVVVGTKSVNTIDTIINHIDEPIADSSLIPTWLVCDAVSQEFKVALGGDGSDELFGGYKHYNTLMIANLFRKLTSNRIKRLASRMLDKYPIGLQGRSILQTLFFSEVQHIGLLPALLPPSLFSFSDIQQLLDADTSYHCDHFRTQQLVNMNPDYTHIVDKATRYDFKNYLPSDILTKVDRMSMYHSLELRSPFLDKDIVEFAFTKLHPSLKATYTDRKVFLKKYARKYLPLNYPYGRKQGFSLPLGQWIRTKGPYQDYFYDNLLTPNSLFSKKYVQQQLDQHINGRRNEHRLFGLLMLNKWINTNSILY